jgi:hypothetical protein
MHNMEQFQNEMVQTFALLDRTPLRPPTSGGAASSFRSPAQRRSENAGANAADLPSDMNYCSERKFPNYAEIVGRLALGLNGYSAKCFETIINF